MISKFYLKITIESNLTKTDFLDVELDLINDSYAPFRKPNFQATYVSAKSNHPRYVVNQIPKSINKKLTTISKDEFKRAKSTARKHLLMEVMSTSRCNVVDAIATVVDRFISRFVSDHLQSVYLDELEWDMLHDVHQMENNYLNRNTPFQKTMFVLPKKTT